jgi:hypothetical protein
MESIFVDQGQAYISTEEGLVKLARYPDGWPRRGLLGGGGGVDRDLGHDPDSHAKKVKKNKQIARKLKRGRETAAVRDDITTPTIFFHYSPTPHSNHPNHPK